MLSLRWLSAGPANVPQTPTYAWPSPDEVLHTVQSEARLRRLEQFTELPLLILALVLIPLLVVPEVANISDGAHDALTVADWLIWALFAVDFGLKLAVAPQRTDFLRHHWFEALMVVLPFLRPLRVARLVRLARVAAVLGVNVHLLRDLGEQRGTRFVVAAVLAVLVAGATLTLLAERQSDEANIRGFGDALWWAATTVTTVGYGDQYPVTPLGRGVAVALMLVGISALSAVTATIAAYLVQEREQAGMGDILAEIRALRAEVVRLQARGTDGDAQSHAPN